MRDGSGLSASSSGSRVAGWEWRTAYWLARHPGVSASAGLVSAGLVEAGPTVMGAVAAGAAAGVAAWSRAHPASFDVLAAPVVRSQVRRWTAYAGPRWSRVMADCELTRLDRRSGRVLVPRVLRVRAASASVETVIVRVLRGQSASVFTDRAEALADALRVERVAVMRHRPGVVAVTVERRLPFTSVVPAPDIPASLGEVDLAALEVGDTETGAPWLVSAFTHRLVAGATGAGKASLVWSPLRSMGPAIREGLVRLWCIDLKGGMETELGAGLFTHRATDFEAAVGLVEAFRDRMRVKQDRARESGTRGFSPSVGNPLDLLVIDEAAMLTALGDPTRVRQVTRVLAEVLTQGRATGSVVWAYLQDPGKDILPVRDLFPERVCLRVTSSVHVDMVLGEDARKFGALADQIPPGEEFAGIGYVVGRRTRRPLRVRAAWVNDSEITELVRDCAPSASVMAPVVALPRSAGGER